MRTLDVLDRISGSFNATTRKLILTIYRITTLAYMIWRKEDRWDSHLPRIALFGWGPFSRQISSDTWFTYTQLVNRLHGLEVERLHGDFASLYYLSLVTVHFSFLLSILLASDTSIVNRTPHLHFCGFLNLALSFDNIMDRFFNTLENHQQNYGSLLYPLENACSEITNGFNSFIRMSGTQSVDGSSHRTWTPHHLLVMTSYSI